jgi:hypothetical protein
MDHDVIGRDGSTQAPGTARLSEFRRLLVPQAAGSA